MTGNLHFCCANSIPPLHLSCNSRDSRLVTKTDLVHELAMSIYAHLNLGSVSPHINKLASGVANALGNISRFVGKSNYACLERRLLGLLVLDPRASR